MNVLNYLHVQICHDNFSSSIVKFYLPANYFKFGFSFEKMNFVNPLECRKNLDLFKYFFFY
jgi:hypothetical protein